MNNDLISREALKKAITEATYNFEQIPIRVDKVQEIIDNAPPVPTVCSTRIASVVDQFGNRIEGYFDESRMLFFSGYGIVTAELLKRKNYKLIFEEEQLRGE